MFERKIYNQIESWKQSLKNKRKALIIKGLRQIGKTTIVNEFCSNNYKSVVYINFMDNKTIKEVFNGDFIVDDMIKGISAIYPNTKFIPYETVIIFDELQECINARSSIKSFMLDGRFDIIATGSLIGLRGYNNKITRGIPTGFEHIINMKPMDFEEYLWAIGIDKVIIEDVKRAFANKEKVDEVINKTFMKYFKDYLCVGGMPDVVNTFISTHDMNQVYDVQNDILNEFQDDFGKHLDESENEYVNKTELVKIMETYKSIPNQLAKENKKFQYNKINKNAKGREYKSAITWLEEFGLINVCYNLSFPALPLEGNKIDDIFKIYVADTGLFVAMLEKGTAAHILFGDLNIYKGAIYEQIVADAFSKMNKKLYYYNKDNKLEIDFITTINLKLTAIEVKATNSKAKSLNEIVNNKIKYNVENNYKLIDGNIGFSNGINTIPLYMAFLLE